MCLATFSLSRTVSGPKDKVHFLPAWTDQCVSEFGMQEVRTDCFRFLSPHPYFRGWSSETRFGRARQVILLPESRL